MAKSPGAEDSSLLGRLAVIAGIVAALATAFGVAWTVLHKDNTDVADYQAQVVATCEQVHTVLATEHNEILTFGGGADATSPQDAFRVKKDVLLQVLRDNLDQTRASFEALDKQQVPKALADKHEAAVAAQQTWLASSERAVTLVRERLRDNARLSELNALGVQVTGDRTLGTRLNAAMTALAGRNCQVTA